MTTKSMRNNGIGHLAARSLLEEIAGLRDDISRMGVAIADIDYSLLLLFQEVRRSSADRRPLPIDHE